MIFEQHQETCQQCRITPSNPCPEGVQILMDEIERIPLSVQQAADGDAARGKKVAMDMMAVIPDTEYEPPVIIHALAFIFAALLSASDGVPALHEEMGGAPVGDSERIALFGLEVKGLLEQFRMEKLRKAMQ